MKYFTLPELEHTLQPEFTGDVEDAALELGLTGIFQFGDGEIFHVKECLMFND